MRVPTAARHPAGSEESLLRPRTRAGHSPKYPPITPEPQKEEINRGCCFIVYVVPPGEPTSPRWAPGRARQPEGQRVDDAVNRARPREMVKRREGEEIPDDLLDTLVGGREDRAGDRSPGGLLAIETDHLAMPGFTRAATVTGFLSRRS